MSREPKNVTPRGGRVAGVSRVLALTLVAALVVVLCVLFPRMLAFVELAARELRYFWWLILLGALGAYFFFFFGRKKE